MKSLNAFTHRLAPALVLAWLAAGISAYAQLPTSEERLKILTDPESVKTKVEKEKTRPPLEFFRSQVAPFDILPYVKANHWSTLSLEMRSNHDDYVGILQTSPVRLLGMPRDGAVALEVPHEVFYRRDAKLLKEQRARLSMQVMLPRVPRELGIEMLRPEAIRADEIWQASLRTLEPHQMLILVLTKDPNDAYARWAQLQSMIPISADRGDPLILEKQRYYRLVLPLEPDQPPLSSHPLTWTTLSHVIWDGMAAETLQPAQQQAMLDWLHWGGQLVLIGGAKPSFAALRDSFLAPYLPADPSGDNALLTQADLAPLSDAYRPPVPPIDREEIEPVPDVDGMFNTEKLYLATAPIVPATNRPVFLAGLRPRPGATVIPLGESSTRLLGVERRVGRGRVLMVTINPIDPALASWPGLDTMIRRVLLRRPEDHLVSPGGWNGTDFERPSFAALSGPELSWFRLMSRDLGAALPRPNAEADAGGARLPSGVVPPTPPAAAVTPVYQQGSSVAEWIDSSALPRMSRDVLEQASGISIPSSSFVLKVILAYVIALVPLNWLICRYLLGRREWAWVVIPILSLGFAVGVERAAAYDMGYDAACDEIDILETYGGYPRAHLSRFASLYTTGRLQFTISFPNDATALALPLDNGRSLRGEDITTSTWQSQPVPALEGFQVQPRSLSLFRAEQMVHLSGAIDLESDYGLRRVVNASDLELRDAVLIDVNGPASRKEETYLGTIAPGTTVVVRPGGATDKPRVERGAIDVRPFLRALRAHAEARPEDQGEIRLVAWSPRVWGGEKLEPAVDRHRSVTAVVVHLRHGPPPAPDGPVYNFLARGTIRGVDLPPPPGDGGAGTRVFRVMPNARRGRRPAVPYRGAATIPGTLPMPPVVPSSPGPSSPKETDRP